MQARLSAEGSSCTSSCMAIINTSSECKGKCMLTVWDNQCLSKRCMVEALWRYTVHAVDASKWLHVCAMSLLTPEHTWSLPMRYLPHLFSVQANLNFSVMKEFTQKQRWGKTLIPSFIWFFLLSVSKSVNDTTEICIIVISSDKFCLWGPRGRKMP